MSTHADTEPGSNLTDFTARLIEAHCAETRFAPDGRVPETLEEALAVQSAVMDRFGPPGAFKVADKAGGPFVMAPIRADRIFRSGDTVSVLDRAGVELEVGFEVISPIPTAGDLSEVAAYLRPLPVIEIVDTRIEGPLADQPFVKLADQQANGALVVGRPSEAWNGADFAELQARLCADGETLFEGQTCVPGGSALTLVTKLLKRLGSHCGGLQPGQIVITGSLNGLPYLTPSVDVVGEIRGLGDVSCRMTCG